jgi:predicted GTPase
LRLHASRPDANDAARVTAGDRRLRRAHGLREVSGGAFPVAASARTRPARRGAAPPDALWRPRAPAGAALRQRADLRAAGCTVEEREEYEPHIAAGNVVFAGVDYAAIARRGGARGDVLVWDGGNNDFPFIRPDLHIVVADALRPDQLDTHHPGETVAHGRRVVVNKVNAAARPAVDALRRRLAAIAPRATIVEAASPVALDAPDAVRGKRAILVEDGPTITHGGMAHGAAHAAALAAGVAGIVDPRAAAAPLLREVYDSHPHIADVVPAVGYGPSQLEALRRTLADSDAEVVISGTPVDLAALIDIDKPIVRARYAYADAGAPVLADVIAPFLDARFPR